MEEKIFQNEYTMSIKLIKEYVYQILCKKIIFIGYIIFIVGIILFFIFENEKSYIMLTAGCISGICALFTPIITVKQIEENSKRLNNGKIEKHLKNIDLQYIIYYVKNICYNRSFLFERK